MNAITGRHHKQLKTLGILALAACFIMAGAGTILRAAPPEGKWESKLADAKVLAARENKPILAMVSSVTCPPCQMMKRAVFPEASVQEELKKFIPLYIDVDIEANIPDAVAVSDGKVPTFTVLDPKGEEMGRLVGARRTAEEFIGDIRGLISFHENLTELDRKLAETPKDAALLKAKGDLLADNGRLDEGIELYNLAVELDPVNKTGAKTDLDFFAIMDTLDSEEALKGGDAALLEFRRKHPTHPRAQDALFIRSMIALHLENLPGATALLQSYKKEYPEGRFKARVDQLMTMIEHVKAQEQAKAAGG
jgi:hypothetical protein